LPLFKNLTCVIILEVLFFLTIIQTPYHLKKQGQLMTEMTYDMS
jgi:hypothetical protein